MRFYKLPAGKHQIFDSAPESAMAVHFARGQSGTLVFVLGGEVVLDPAGADDEAVEGLLQQPWLSWGAEGDRVAQFSAWLDTLEEWPFAIAPLPPDQAAPPPPITAVPPPPPYGHLPYSAIAGPGAVFYRWEAWPRSRRINQNTGKIASGTFTAPYSEAPFAPTGFSAVARFALPNLAPACFRWELRPPQGTRFRCGASVPRYGQSGGGVEAEFTAGFTNVGPIANPVALDAL